MTRLYLYLSNAFSHHTFVRMHKCMTHLANQIYHSPCTKQQGGHTHPAICGCNVQRCESLQPAEVKQHDMRLRNHNRTKFCGKMLLWHSLQTFIMVQSCTVSTHGACSTNLLVMTTCSNVDFDGSIPCDITVLITLKKILGLLGLLNQTKINKTAC